MNDKLPFDWPTQPNIPARPKRYDAAVVRRAAEAAAAAIDKQWSAFDTLEDREQMVDDLIDALDGAFSYDGYAICRRLESHACWAPDAELVDILDDGHVFTAHNEAVKEWVDVNGIKPAHSVGDEVNTSHGIGTVRMIYEEKAEYLVAIDDDKNHKYIVAYEDTTI